MHTISTLRRLASSLVLVACVAACRAEAGGDGSPDAPQIVATEDLRLGETEDDPALTFGGIGGLMRHPRGRILVVDMQAHEARVFEPDGSHAFTFGRQGGGPGEMRFPCCPAFGPDGLLWIRDSGNGRYTAFAIGDTGAEPRGQIRMSHADRGRVVETTFDADGSLIDVGSGQDANGGRLSTVRYSRSRDDSLVRRIAVHEPPAESLSTHSMRVDPPGEGFSIFYFHQPYGPQHVVAHGPGGEWAQAVTSTYAVSWRQSDGALLRTIARQVEGPRLTADEHARADSNLARDARRAGGPLPFDVPERKPPIRALYFDEIGRLWVERWVAQGAPREADVWSRDGTLLFTLEWPADVDLAWGWRGKHEALGSARDELGVQRVVRIRWE